MSNEPKFYTFEEWIEKHKEVMAQVKTEVNRIDDCEECDGTGRHTCDCGHEHDCEECDGSGKISKEESEKLTEKEIKRTALARYNEQKKYEIKLWYETKRTIKIENATADHA